jgi:hypothetical protein
MRILIYLIVKKNKKQYSKYLFPYFLTYSPPSPTGYYRPDVNIDGYLERHHDAGYNHQERTGMMIFLGIPVRTKTLNQGQGEKFRQVITG